MKNFKKVLSFMLALLIFCGAFVACDSSEETTEQPESESETEVILPRPKAEYDSELFIMIHGDSNKYEYHWVKESSNDLLSQAIYDRQQKIYNHLGVDIVGIRALATYNYVEPFKNSVKNKDGSVDILLTHVYHGIDGFITGNYLADLREVPGVNLDADYWNLEVMEDAAINEALYLGKSDFNILNTNCITFNKDILDKYDDVLEESVYDMVENYRWTLDSMINLANLVYVDKVGDGKTIDDTFGIAGDVNVPGIGFLNAANVSLVDKNEAGQYKFSAYNELNKEKTSAVVEKLIALVDSDCAWMWLAGRGEPLTFEKGTSMMMLTPTNNLPNLLNYDINFGVLPYPMYDEGQKDVGYRSLQWGGYTCVPSYVKNIDMVGDTLEMLSFYSEDVNEAFYEKLLGKQVAETPIDKRMLEIIWDSICADFAQTYFSALFDTQVLYMIPTLIKPNRNQNLSSYVAGTEKSVNKLLMKLTYNIK